ncbi:MAG TPA: PGPGW domain-containing protein [Gaiellaceae bacterium]|jgi:uncharacterized protein (TIGR02611 family)
MKPGARGRFFDGMKERRERHRMRNRIVRIAAALGGFLIMLVGIILIPLPGPGLLVVAVGLGVLALEFAWAEHLLERTLDRLSDAGEKVRRASRLEQALVGLLGALVAAAALTAAYAWDLPLLPV